MSAQDLILIGGAFIGIVSSYLIGRMHGFEIGTDHGRQLESLDQMSRKTTMNGSTVFDRSPKTFPGMSEVKAVDVRRIKP